MTSMAEKAHWLDLVQNRQSSRLAYGLDASRAAGARQQPSSFEILADKAPDSGIPTFVLVAAGLAALYFLLK